MNGVVAHGSFETTTTPARCLFAFDHEERDPWRKRRRAIDERLENVGLRLLVVYLGNGRLHDGHVAGSLRAGRLGSGQLDATFVGSVQMFRDGSYQAAFHLHIRLAVKKVRK